MKLTAAERAAQATMLSLLEYATATQPNAWHGLDAACGGKATPADLKAVKLLQARGVIQYWPETGLYKLTPKD